MSRNPALDARCDYALYKLLGVPKEKQLCNALRLAKRCGYDTYPNKQVSPLIAEEPELLAAYRKGWAQRQHEDRPKSREDLAAAIEKMNQSALQGCGQFYELFAQSFTSAVDSWLDSLREGERVLALELLQGTAYEPDAKGHWSYDVEDNDITFHPGEDS